MSPGAAAAAAGSPHPVRYRCGATAGMMAFPGETMGNAGFLGEMMGFHGEMMGNYGFSEGNNRFSQGHDSFAGRK